MSKKGASGSTGKPMDERFARISYDPSFKSMKKTDKKTKIDKRFAGVFNEKRFKVVAKTDKYGNELEVEDGRNKEMEEYYYKDSEEEVSEEEVQEKVKSKKDKKKDNKKAQQEVEIEQTETKKKDKKGKSKVVEPEPSEESDSEDESSALGGSFSWHEVSSSDEELEFDDEYDNQEEYHYGVEKEAAPVGEASSKRLALLNYDWQAISASDIMLLFNSFKDQLGVITKVTVYPSDFGLKMIATENELGPTNIWRLSEKTEEGEEAKAKQDDEKNDKKDSKKKNKDEKKKDKKPKSLFESKKANFLNHTVVAKIDDDQCDLDPVKLREYERSRMRYYYAVIECDSKRTAEKIYEQCDGMDFEMSGIPIDLRFVPDEQKFPHAPKEECDEVPSDCQVKSFVNRSIGHTNTRLTWDQPTDRFSFMNGKMTEKDYEKIDWSKYIAPADEGEDNMNDDEDDLKEDALDQELDSDEEIAALEREAMREEQALNNISWKSAFDKRGKSSKLDDQIEVRFRQGFDTIGNRILEKQKAKNETIFETRDRHRQEKKKIHKQNMKDKMRDSRNKKLGFSGDNESRESAAESAKQRAQLELLVEHEPKQKEAITFNDSRFNPIFESNDYAIDPTSKFYNKEHSKNILEAQIKNRKKRRQNEEQ